jgi:hypothetical protein
LRYHFLREQRCAAVFGGNSKEQHWRKRHCVTIF